MLEVRNLFKIYKSKQGEDVRALDGVSIQFPEKGMVFLLGKSGSGKSTLLNVCGGLDAPTDGEVIVKGRSSKNFSQSDFDSYRNTFVGFIFQEYNILNEFSVEDNIALALELQGKSKNKKAVTELLKQVDLEGYGKRKPNTLSGGQKQRIAIARALVKSPEIIMADEPTGALDSHTGKQVFETLKKLSKDKLVLVVSHDREFAEQYGDRIIELQDGKVISDVTKGLQEQQEVSENMNAVGDVLCIKQGSELSDKDFEEIKNFLKRADGDVIIASGSKDVKTFKKANRITEDGAKEVFQDTDVDGLEVKEYKPEDSKFIRSKLPVRHAVRIGLSGMMRKPFRLFFTIFLSTIAFIFFGLLSTMSFYQREATFKQTMLDSVHDMLRFEKIYQAEETTYYEGKEEDTYTPHFEGRFTQAELEELEKEFGSEAFGALRVDMSYDTRSNTSSYWQNMISSVGVLPEDHTLRGKINGEYPIKKDEICISSYMADVIVNCKAFDDQGDIIDVSKREDLIGKKINIQGSSYKITGIIDSGSISDKYEVFESEEEDNGQLLYQYLLELSEGLHLTLFVSSETLEDMSMQYVPYTGEKLLWYRPIVVAPKNQKGAYEFSEYANGRYGTIEEAERSEKVVFFEEGKTTISDNEVVVSLPIFCEWVSRAYDDKITNYNDRGEYTKAERLYKSVELNNQVWNGGIWKDNKTIPFTEAEMEQKIQALMLAIKTDGIKLTAGMKLFNTSMEKAFGDVREFTVSGVIYGISNDGQDKVLMSDSNVNTMWEEQKQYVGWYSVITTNYKESDDAIYDIICLTYGHSHEQTNLFWNMYNNTTFGEDDSRVKPTGSYIDQLELVDELISSLSKIFLWVGVVFAIFAILLLSNFISVSISQKKKEIGILRAVGARSFDVFKIFFSESFFIASICVVIAAIASSVICKILNQELAAELGASLFVFGILSLLVLIAIAFVTTIIATFLPVWNAAKKKPVDSIRAL